MDPYISRIEHLTITVDSMEYQVPVSGVITDEEIDVIYCDWHGPSTPTITTVDENSFICICELCSDEIGKKVAELAHKLQIEQCKADGVEVKEWEIASENEEDE